MDEKERKKLRYEFRKLNGLCIVCGNLNDCKSVKCLSCKEISNIRQRNERETSTKCSRCYLVEKESGKSLCRNCLNAVNKKAKELLKTHFGYWKHVIRNASRKTAIGSDGKSKHLKSKLIGWDHKDFAKAFPNFQQSGKDLDHIIPLACAESSPDQLDKDFGDLASSLQNLQLLTRSENVTKAANLDRQIKARALALRQQGKHGAELFHQLWAEFAYPQRQEEGNQDALPNG